MRIDGIAAHRIARRRLLSAGLVAAGTMLSGATSNSGPRATGAKLPAGNGTANFADKRAMIVQRVRPPLLETPMEVFDEGVFTPNDRFFVRWHWADIPLAVDVDSFRLEIGGHVEQPLTLSIEQILSLPRMQLAAINQCSGNSRALFEPRVPGAQWSHGAMGNALWEGVSLRAVLDLAGVRAGAREVRLSGMDRPLTQVDPFRKSLAIDHARDGEVMLAFAMNREQLPLLNGFPLRLIVPGWFSTYWVKALNRIEVAATPDENYWMAKAYKVPTTEDAGVVPGSTGYETRPISTMVPRSFITNVRDGDALQYAPRVPLRGIAMGGDQGVAQVEVSADNGAHWHEAQLEEDFGRYSFRRFHAEVPITARGPAKLLARCTNTAGATQDMDPIWNPGGYMRGNVEAVHASFA